jgi:hypothetical protein
MNKRVIEGIIWDGPWKIVWDTTRSPLQTKIYDTVLEELVIGHFDDSVHRSVRTSLQNPIRGEVWLYFTKLNSSPI